MKDIIYCTIIVMLLAYGATTHYAYMELKLKHEVMVTALKPATVVVTKAKDFWKNRKAD